MVDTRTGSIDTLLHEERRYSPSAEFRKAAKWHDRDDACGEVRRGRTFVPEDEGEHVGVATNDAQVEVLALRRSLARLGDDGAVLDRDEPCAREAVGEHLRDDAVDLPRLR